MMGRSDVALTLSSFKMDLKLVYGDTNTLEDVDVSKVLFTASLNSCDLELNDGVGSTKMDDCDGARRDFSSIYR